MVLLSTTPNNRDICKYICIYFFVVVVAAVEDDKWK